MKIVFIAEGDAANVLTEYSYCLNNHCNEIQTKTICLFPHPFNYKIKHDINLNSCDNNQIQNTKKIVEESDIVIFAEEGILPGKYKTIDKFNSIFNIDLLDGTKKIIIWHPGSNYRNNYQYYNTHPLRNKIFKHLYAIDLHRLSPQSSIDLILPPYQYFRFNKTTYINNFLQKLHSTRPTITHIPSSKYKGTTEIINALQTLNLNQKYNIQIINNIKHTDVLQLKQKSLFYIDQYYLPTGSYGIAALEGLVKSNFTFSTLNKITNTIYNLYGEDFPIANLGPTTETMQKVLEFYLLKISKEELEERIYEIANWIETFLTPQYIVNKFNTEILA